MKKWEELPVDIKNEQVRYYYDILKRHTVDLIMKRIFDIVMSIVLLVLLSPVFLILGIAIKLDSRGSVMFRQERVTQYGKKFRIYKFRTMVQNAEKLGSQVTTNSDARITRVGKVLRKIRLDEIPQLINILVGDMTFVGTRPEVMRYVDKYTAEMKATLLLPAGVTSRASIAYKDEEKLLTNADNVDEVYIKCVLPEKMKYNLKAIEEFSCWEDVKTMVYTIIAVIK